MAAAPATNPAVPVLAERGGTQLRTPKAIVLVDTREQHPFDFARFEGWFAGIERRTLGIGDYSVSGLEDICVVERKDLADLVHSFTVERPTFIKRLKRMSTYPNKLLVITASLSSVKSRYPFSPISPNRVLQALIAAFVGWGVPFLCAETHEREKRSSLPTCTKSISIIGWRPTATRDISQTRICSPCLVFDSISRG
jgi:ERCC4-type nuclease